MNFSQWPAINNSLVTGVKAFVVTLSPERQMPVSGGAVMMKCCHISDRVTRSESADVSMARMKVSSLE